MTLGDAVTGMVDALNGAGIPATADPQTINPPAVWVQFESAAHNLLSGAVTARLRLYLIVGDAGTVPTLDALSGLLAAVCGVVTPNTDLDTTVAAVQLPDNPSTPLPALQMTVDTHTTL